MTMYAMASCVPAHELDRNPWLSRQSWAPCEPELGTSRRACQFTAMVTSRCMLLMWRCSHVRVRSSGLYVIQHVVRSARAHQLFGVPCFVHIFQCVSPSPLVQFARLASAPLLLS
jgi:hypothetical protein